MSPTRRPRVPPSASTDAGYLWTDDDVFDFLREVGAPIARYYDDGKNAQGPECATCSAWWDEGRAAYLRKHHPDLAERYAAGVSTIANELRRPIEQLDSELGALFGPQHEAA